MMASAGNKVARLRYQDLLTTRDGSVPDKDSKLKNVIIEGVNGKPQILKRPGYTNVLAVGPAKGRGLFSLIDSAGAEHLYAVSGGTVYSIAQAVTVANNWTTLASPTAGVAFLYFLLNDVLYAYRSSTLAYYKTSTSASWVSFIPTGLPAISAGGMPFSGNIPVMGGIAYWIGTAATDVASVYVSYDGMAWSLLTASGNPGFWQTTVIVYNNKLWIVSGTDSTSTFQNKVYSSSNGSSWTSVNATPAYKIAGSPRYYFGTLVLNSKMYIIGGTDLTNLKSDVYSSTDGNTWTQETAAGGWTAAQEMATIAIGSTMYVFGGYTNNSTYASSTQQYSSSDGVTWANLGAMSTKFPVDTGGANTATLAIQWQNQIVLLKLATTINANLYQGNAQVLQLAASSLGSLVCAANDMVDYAITYDGTKIFVKSSVAAAVITVSSGAVAAVTVNYPTTTARGIAYLDGTFYVMDTSGTIYGSGTNDPTTWTALNTIAAQAEPDGGVCLQKLNQYVIAFGRYTTQPFFDNGNATGSPLSALQNGIILYGCTNQNSVAFVDGSIYFAAQSKAQGQSYSAGIQIGKLSGLNYARVSTDSVERILNADTLSGCVSSGISIFGHSIYILTLINSSMSLAYDVDSNQWYEFSVRTTGGAYTVSALTATANVDGTTVTASATCTGHPFSDGDKVTIAGASPSAYNLTDNITVTGANSFTYQIPSVPALTTTGTITATGTTENIYPLISSCNFTNAQILQNWIDGSINQIVDTTYTDNIVFIDSAIRTTRFDNDSNQQKFCGWMDLVTDRTTGNALVRYTDDDYQTFSKFRKTSLSGKRSRLNRQGAFKRRAFEIRITDNIAFRFQGLDLGVEQGIE